MHQLPLSTEMKGRHHVGEDLATAKSTLLPGDVTTGALLAGTGEEEDVAAARCRREEQTMSTPAEVHDPFPTLRRDR